MTDHGPLIPRNRAIHPEPYDPGYKTSVARSPFLPLLSMESTPSEETGPRFGHTKLGALDNNLILNWTKGAAPAVGERILVHGRLLDEMNRPIPNALIEIWQANAGGRYRHKKDTYFAPLDPNFGGCGRTLTDENGYFLITAPLGSQLQPYEADGTACDAVTVDESLLGEIDRSIAAYSRIGELVCRK